MERAENTLPTIGERCPKCGMPIPQFADLRDADHQRILKLISSGQKIVAVRELRIATGCPLTWAKLWVMHSGRAGFVEETAPCPYCGKPLKTDRARQCQHCLMDWHDPQNPKKLG